MLQFTTTYLIKITFLSNRYPLLLGVDPSYIMLYFIKRLELVDPVHEGKTSAHKKKLLGAFRPSD